MAGLREHPPIKPFTVKWDGVALFEKSDHDPKKLKNVGGRPADYSADDLLKALANKMTSGEWQAEAAEHHGIKGKHSSGLRKSWKTPSGLRRLPQRRRARTGSLGRVRFTSLPTTRRRPLKKMSKPLYILTVMTVNRNHL
jgi:hypothetical protein